MITIQQRNLIYKVRERLFIRINADEDIRLIKKDAMRLAIDTAVKEIDKKNDGERAFRIIGVWKQTDKKNWLKLYQELIKVV